MSEPAGVSAGEPAASSSVFMAVLQQLPACTGADGELLTAPFLEACRLVVPVIESLGTAFTPARMDVSGNIDRLAARHAADPAASAKLFDVVRAEVDDGTASGSKSCTKGLLWLKRFLDFTVRILERLARDPALELGAAASAAYDAALRPYHGYLTCALFSVVLHAAPYRATFEAALVRQGAAAGPEQPDSEQLREHMTRFVEQFAPLLARIHVFLSETGQDDPTPV